jgi:hypothetical protein
MAIFEKPDGARDRGPLQGAVLSWNSRAIHGSVPPSIPPVNENPLPAKKFVNYKIYNGTNFYRNQPDYSVTNSIT